MWDIITDGTEAATFNWSYRPVDTPRSPDLYCREGVDDLIQRVLKIAGIVAAAAFGVLALIGLVVSPRSGPAQYLDRAEDLFGARMTISAWSSDAGQMPTRDAVSDACGQIISAAAAFDRNDADSELSRACAAKTAVELSPQCAQAVESALAAARESSGAWDPTAAPLMAHYRAMLGGGAEPKLPDGARLAQWRAAIGHERVRLDGLVLTLEAGTELDLGDLGRGRAVDEAAEALKKAGVLHGMVSLGAQKRVLGARHDSSSWLVAIESPRPQRATGGFLGFIRMADAAVSTATDGGPPFSAGGRSHSRVIDPRTGLPAGEAGGAAGSAASVTVVADRCDRAAWLARALLVIGPAEGVKFVEATRGVSALFVTIGEDGAPAFVTAGSFPTLRLAAREGGRR